MIVMKSRKSVNCDVLNFLIDLRRNTMIKILLATMISISSIGFTNEASEEWNDELREAIQANENQVVDHYDEDKIYVKPEKIHPTPQGVYLNLNEDEYIFVPSLRSDNQGCYVQVFNFNPLPSCPGCGTTYLYGDCGKQSCPKYQKRHQNIENHKKEQQKKKDDYKKSKKEHKNKKK